MTENDNITQIRAHTYIIHELYYVNNLEDVPRPTYDARCHISSEIIYRARGPVIKLFNVFTMFDTLEDALQKIAEALKPGKKSPHILAAKFALVPSNLSSQKWIRTERPAKLQHLDFQYMDIPSPCLTLYEMPVGYSMPYPVATYETGHGIQTDIHRHCTNLAKIVYFDSEYKPYVSFVILSAYLGDLILNKYSMIWEPLYKWVQEYIGKIYFLSKCEFIKVGPGHPYLSKRELIDMYTEVTGHMPNWYQRMFPNRYMAPICQQREIQIKYAELLDYAKTRPRKPESLRTVQSTLV